MQNSNWRFNKAGGGPEWYVTYVNKRGGTILLTYDGKNPLNWTHLPKDFPVEDAKKRLYDLARR